MKLLFKLIIFSILILTCSLLMQRAFFDIRALSQINPIPKAKELIDEKKFVDAYEYLDYFLQFDYMKDNQEALSLLDQINQERNKLSYKSEKIFEGLTKGISDETIGNTSAIISDFFLLGDLRDLTIQGMNYYNNEEVDEVLVGLSMIGVIASATSYATAQTTASSKVAISSLKIARRSNKMPPWISKYLKNSLPLIKESKDIKPISKLIHNVEIISDNTKSISQTINIISKTEDIKSLAKASKLSSNFSKNTNTLLKVAGKNSINLLDSLKYNGTKAVLLASSYGENGLKALGKLGTKRFLLRVGKTTYKGNFDFIYNYLLKTIPTYILLLIIFFCGFYFLNLFRKALK